MKERYGIAIDIGTTTVTTGLVDIAKGTELARLWGVNPQIEFGEDVISRLSYCAKTKTGLVNLHKAITGCAGVFIKRLLKEQGLKESGIEKVVVVGNTAMEHFFLKVPPAKLGRAPYVSSLPKGVIGVRAVKLGLPLGSAAKVYLLPVVKSFVGSDLTAGILYTRLFEKKSANILVDIGTNGEIALVKDKKIFVASTAAGPAFETRGKGTAGSKLIEAISAMLKNGSIDKTGRLIKTAGSKITQEDVRRAQVAKAAIMSGILVLVKNAGLGLEDIENLYVAGKFGNYIDTQAAVNIGLLPDIGLSRIKFVGNAAYKGACLALYSEGAMKKSEEIAKMAVHIGLFGRNDFKEDFIKHMGF